MGFEQEPYRGGCGAFPSESYQVKRIMLICITADFELDHLVMVVSVVLLYFKVDNFFFLLSNYLGKC